MSEEIENAPLIFPRALLSSYLINGVGGLGMLIVALFCIQDIGTVLDPPSGYAFIEIFQSTTGSNGGTAAMIAMILLMYTACEVSVVAGSSRQLWAFSRDHGVPGWRLLSRVDKHTSRPIWSIGMTALISVLLSLINFGSSVVFQNLGALSVSGLYSSYLLAASLLLYRRLTGSIQPFNGLDKGISNVAGRQLTWVRGGSPECLVSWRTCLPAASLPWLGSSLIGLRACLLRP